MNIKACLKLSLCILAILGGWVELDAQVRNVDKWDKEHELLCTYDSYCNNLFSYSGQWLEPRSEIKVLIKRLSPYIYTVAKKYNVDEEAIVSVIMAEDAMNTNFSDELQDLIVWMNIAPVGKILGRSFSIGLGQINVDVAQKVESYAAKVDSRKVRTRKQVALALLNVEESINYIAAILSAANKAYSANGVDLKDKPEILVSLFNLGEVEKRAKNIHKGYVPRENYFGFFFRKYVQGRYKKEGV